MRSTSLAFCLSASPTAERYRHQHALEILRRIADRVVARVERVGGRLGARFDLLGHVLGAADQQFLEPADAGVESVGDFQCAGAERPVDLVDLGADRVGELGAAHVDRAGDVADALVERGDDLLAAFGQRLGDVHDARAKRSLSVWVRLSSALLRSCRSSALVEVAGDLVALVPTRLSKLST